jgi:hypothetical protein
MYVRVCSLRSSGTPLRICCFVISALLITSTLAVSVGCGKFSTKSDLGINLVRNGFLKVRLSDSSVKIYDSMTIGKALERKFKNGIWRQFTSPEGELVEFDATVWPATLYQSGFSVWSPFLKKDTAETWGVPGEKGSLSLRAATTCIDDGQKRVAVGHNGGRIVIDCRLLFQMQFRVAADESTFDLHYISLATFDTDDQGKTLGYIYG